MMIYFYTTRKDVIKPVIYKIEDDIRNDELVVQMFQIMDDILQANNVQNYITPYACVATGWDSGFIDPVKDSEAVATIQRTTYVCKRWKSDGSYMDERLNAIIGWIKAHNETPHDREIAFEKFLKSTAAYSVITYILGIGDRHLDNLMVTKDGRLFHIDFGWIWGEDPKPFMPKMKICKEMLDAIGGRAGPEYTKFVWSVVRVFGSCARMRASLLLCLSWVTSLFHARQTTPSESAGIRDRTIP